MRLAISHPFPVSRSLIACAVSICCLGSAFSQETSTLNTVVITASGREQAIKEAPASISVITREDLDKKPYTSLQDVVKDLEGVNIVGSSPNDSEISIRGMPGEYTLILVDGKRQGTRETMNRGSGGYQSNLIPPLSAIERIEVVRGPMSSLYGADAIGGVINIITRKVPKAWSGSTSIGAVIQQDSKAGNTTLGSFWLGGPIKDDVVGLQFYGKYRDRKEDQIFYPLSSTSGAYGSKDESLTAKITIKPAENHDVTLEAGREKLTYRSTPGRTLAPSSRPSTVIARRQERTNLAMTHNGRYDFGQSTMALYQEVAKQMQWSATGQNPVVPKVTNTILDGFFTMPIGNSVAKVGGQYIHNELTGIAGQDAAPRGSGSNPNTIKLKSWALFVEDEFFVTDKFTVTGGVRLDDDERYGRHWTPRLYGVYQLDPRWTIRGGVAQGFKAPSIRQSTAGYCMTTGGAGAAIPGMLCGDANLKPESSTSSEFGVGFDAGASKVSATLFNNEFKNKVVSYDTGIIDSLDRRLFIYDNIDRVTLRGLELSANTSLSREWALSGNYTYTKSVRKGGSESSSNGGSMDGKPLEKTPKHAFHAQVDWTPSAAWQIYAGTTYVSSQYWAALRNGSRGVRERQASTTFDLGGSYVVNKNVSVKLSMLNLTNKIVPVDSRRGSDGLDGNWMVDEGRRLSVMLEAQF
ncbi:ligand-gated channel protein [Polaromonas sp.]|nr:ligand-gated channel protein [Polaromonas sp.]